MYLWELPEVVLFHIVSFVEAPTRRARTLCHQIAPLCKASSHAVLLDEDRSVNLWEIILKEDYCVNPRIETSTTTHTGGPSKTAPCITTRRRACKRLRRSPVQKVRDAHVLLKEHTEICFLYLTHLTTSSSKSSGLSRAKFVRLIDDYGPHLRVNDVVSSGGLFLVEVCRARNVKESVILKCVQELVEHRGAMVNVSTCEQPGSSELTALAVAAARGMPTIVQYLLSKGADRSIRSSGRFRLHTNSKKTLRCNSATPLEFAQEMVAAEKQEGASDQTLVHLNKCAKLLQQEKR